MNRVFGFVLTLAALATVGCENKATLNHSIDGEGVIYGDDDRLEVSHLTQLVEMSESTAVVMKKWRVEFDEEKKTATLKSRTFGKKWRLCSDEPFFQEPAPGFCSGFLVSPTQIVTAGHCAKSQEHCKDSTFIFGFHKKGTTEQTLTVSADQVYSCKRLLGREQYAEGDWAILELDRPVMGRKPLPFNLKKLTPGDRLYVIGNPGGLPTKIDGGGKVRSTTDTNFVATLDTYAASSGSAVINRETLEVVGLVSRGEDDFVFNSEENCFRSNRCTMDGCDGETITKMTMVCDLGHRKCDPDNQQ